MGRLRGQRRGKGKKGRGECEKRPRRRENKLSNGRADYLIFDLTLN